MVTPKLIRVLTRPCAEPRRRCQRCPKEAKRDLFVFLVLFIVCAPLAFLSGKMLIDPDLAPIASPVISIIFLCNADPHSTRTRDEQFCARPLPLTPSDPVCCGAVQIACQFDDAIAGGLWPPLVQAAFDTRAARCSNFWASVQISLEAHSPG